MPLLHDLGKYRVGPFQPLDAPRMTKVVRPADRLPTVDRSVELQSRPAAGDGVEQQHTGLAFLIPRVALNPNTMSGLVSMRIC